MVGLAFLFSSWLIGAAFGWLSRWPRLQAAAGAVAVGALVLTVGAYQFPRPFWPVAATHAAYLSYETTYRGLGTTGGNELLPAGATGAPAQPAMDAGLVRVALLQPKPGQSGAVLAAGPQSLRLHVQVDADSVVTLAQFYFPGWRATVDGRPAPIWAAEATRCIQMALPAGTHDVALLFGDTPVRRLGGLVSLLALLATAIIAWRLPQPAKGDDRPQPYRTGGWPAFGLVLALLAARTLWPAAAAAPFTMNSPAGISLYAQNDFRASIGETATLIGYDLGSEEVTAGGELHVRLYWQADKPSAKDYASYVQLIGGPERRSFAASNHEHPGRIPLSTWQAGKYVIDDHTLRVPADTPPVPLRLEVGLFDLASGKRSGSAELPPWIYVEPSRPQPAASLRGRVSADFAGGIRLLGEQLETTEDGLVVRLVWQAGPTPPADHQVFLHVVDQSGAVLAQGDGAPVGGLYPTSLWRPGHVVVDERRVALPTGAAPAAVLVGLYDLDTLGRLPAWRPDGTPWRDAAVRIDLPSEGQ